MHGKGQLHLKWSSCLLADCVIYRFCCALALSTGIYEKIFKLVYSLNLLFTPIDNNKHLEMEREDVSVTALSTSHSQIILGNRYSHHFKEVENKDHGS